MTLSLKKLRNPDSLPRQNFEPKKISKRISKMIVRSQSNISDSGLFPKKSSDSAAKPTQSTQPGAPTATEPIWELLGSKGLK